MVELLRAELQRLSECERRPDLLGMVVECGSGTVLAAHRIVKIRKNIGIMEK
jgi:hypothetical protein